LRPTDTAVWTLSFNPRQNTTQSVTSPNRRNAE
jgi:hypothetical protein